MSSKNAARKAKPMQKASSKRDNAKDGARFSVTRDNKVTVKRTVRKGGKVYSKTTTSSGPTPKRKTSTKTKRMSGKGKITITGKKRV